MIYARPHERFPLGATYDLEVWRRPGAWASDGELRRMVADLRAVALAGQEGKEIPEYGVLVGDRGDLRDRVVTVAYDRATGEPAGFSALCLLDVPIGSRVETVVHLGLTFVHPDHQRQGLPRLLYGAPAFLLLFETGLRGFWVSNVSQVPAVVGMASEVYADVYPHYAGRTRQSFTHLMLARQILRLHRAAFGVGPEAAFVEALQVITNAYTGGSDHLKKTFEEAPKHRVEEANAFCARHLDYRRGDDFLQLGRCTLGSSLAFLAEKLPEGSGARLALVAARLLAVALVVPVVRWLVPEPPRLAEVAGADRA